jgi:hypothetical protein
LVYVFGVGACAPEVEEACVEDCWVAGIAVGTAKGIDQVIGEGGGDLVAFELEVDGIAWGYIGGGGGRGVGVVAS